MFAATQACGQNLVPPVSASDPSGWQLPGGAAHGLRGVIVLLVDGLGWEQLRERAGHAPFLTGATASAWRTGFPSTTVASLGTLGTGRPPGQTALAAYQLRDPVTLERATLISWDTPTPPEVWQDQTTVFERAAAAGNPVSFVGQPRFAGSALTRAALRGATFASANSPGQLEAAAAAGIDRGGVTYAYWGDLDKQGHAHGWQSAAWAAALETLDQMVRVIATDMGPDREIWVTADHGMVDVDAAPRWDIAELPALAQDVALVAGEPRAVQLYTDDPDAVQERWQAELGEAAWVLTKEQAVGLGLFGAVSDRVQPYLGDVIAAMAGRATIVDSRWSPASALQMVGHHGSLTSAEMDIPFIRIGY
jgi:hypothetical protein